MSASIQISALAGVIVGAGASYVTTLLTESARWRRQQAVRWDEKRLTAYADYLHAIKDIVSVAYGLAAHRGLTDDVQPIAPTDQNLKKLREAEAERGVLIETVRLLTDTDTITATRHLNHCAWHLVSLARGEIPGDREAWKVAWTAYRHARDEYHRCARETLGISGAAISRDLTWPPAWRQQTQTPPQTGPTSPSSPH